MVSNFKRSFSKFSIAAGVARKILLDTQNNTSLNKTGADEVWQSLVAGLKDF
jgi:hypothetical protein